MKTNYQQAFILFLASLYLVISIGLAMNIHTCEGLVMEASLVELASKPCPKCISKQDCEDKCCQNELEMLQIDAEDYYPSLYEFKFTQLFASIIPFFQFSFLIDFQNLKSNSPGYSFQEKISPNEFIYILNCVYRI